MGVHSGMRRLAAGCLLLAVVMTGKARAGDDNMYVGAEKCKNCHAAASKGDQYDKWQQQKHRQAYELLASDEAQKLGKAKGVDDPRKSAQCLRCHETAFEAPAAQKGKKFDPAMGVQCESCHGPRDKHVKARTAAEEESGDKPIELPKGEAAGTPTAETCRKCHNADSPTTKPFSFRKMAKEIAHLDPRKPRPADYFDKLPDDVPEKK
jgi:hypothetical protein